MICSKAIFAQHIIIYQTRGVSYMNKNNVADDFKKHYQPRPWLTLVVIVLAAFMDLMDICIVNVAIPSIQRELNVNYSIMQWVIAGYSLSFSVFLITGGRLGDIFGRKRMFLIGVTGFTIFSATCGFADSGMVLIISRILQGSMAAIMIPQVLSIIQVSFSIEERGKAAAIYGAIAGLATVCGPVLGAILTHNNLFNLTWRPIFLINVPIGIIVIIAASIMIKESKAHNVMGVDVIGVVLISAALFSLLYPFIQGRELDWPAWGFALIIAVSIIFLVGFIAYERKLGEKGSPLIVLDLFKQKAFTSGLLVNFFVYAGVQAFFLIFTIYFQVGLGYSVMSSGLISLPWSIGLMIASAVASQKVYTIGKKVLYLGTALLSFGMACLVIAIACFGIDIKVWQIAIPLFIGGFGMGCVAPTLITIIISGVHHNDAGSASGIINTFTQIGNAVGIAVIGIIFFSFLAGTTPQTLDNTIPEMKNELQQIGVEESKVEQIAIDYKEDYLKELSSDNGYGNNDDTVELANQIGEMEKKIKRVTDSTTAKVMKITFSDSVKVSLIVVVVLFLLSLSMLIFFPKGVKIEENNDIIA